MNVKEINNPLINHKLAILRDKNTGAKAFREISQEIAMLLLYESLKDAKVEEATIDTPLTQSKVEILHEENYAILPILRTGNTLLNGALEILPNAKIGHIGMYRDANTFRPVDYFFKVPQDIAKRETIILDTMLATGGSALDAIDLLKNKNVTKITFICIVASPEGIEVVTKKHPDVRIFCAKIDEHLDEKKYIIPGLGDAGERMFGTK